MALGWPGSPGKLAYSALSSLSGRNHLQPANKEQRGCDLVLRPLRPHGPSGPAAGGYTTGRERRPAHVALVQPGAAGARHGRASVQGWGAAFRQAGAPETTAVHAAGACGLGKGCFVQLWAPAAWDGPRMR